MRLLKLLSYQHKQRTYWLKLIEQVQAYEVVADALIEDQQAWEKRIIALKTEFRTLLINNKFELKTFLKRPKNEYERKLLVEILALIRAASKKVLGLRLYDVQLMGALALHEGFLAEMKTGEGKTLALTPAVILNALTGEPVHVVTVNEYLATRDSEQMRVLYACFGLTTGLLMEGQPRKDRQEAYKCDIVYGVNSEFGFDYLKDNMVEQKEDRMQRGLGFAVIDEVDSILIDEARTPLIISGPDNDDLTLYQKIWAIVNAVIHEDLDAEIDYKKKNINLHEIGFAKLEVALLEAELISTAKQLYENAGSHILRIINACLQAKFLFKKDHEYIIKNGNIAIVDEFTGRVSDDRRWSNGIHQAIEAKEGLIVNQENKTLGTITYQNFFKLYKKMAGLSGTIMTQEIEFAEIYGINCVAILTNKQVIREDCLDVIYRYRDEKFEAIVQEIKEAQAKNQPVLAGTGNIEDSEYLSMLLDKNGVEHQMLNAKNHQREAFLIAQAGLPGMVTVATNMAGRGTDIILGGNIEVLERELNKQKEAEWMQILEEINKQMQEKMSQIKIEVPSEAFADLSEEVRNEYMTSIAQKALDEILLEQRVWFEGMLAEQRNILEQKYINEYDRLIKPHQKNREIVRNAGGLYVIGSMRHESRRIDLQLRGRSGRQGDPGKSKFFISLEDPLFKGYHENGFIAFMDKHNLMPRGTALEHPRLAKNMESAQKQLENIHFNIRKQLLDFDQVGHEQRKAVYQWRQELLETDNPQVLLDLVNNAIYESVESIIDELQLDKFLPEQWDVKSIEMLLQESFVRVEFAIDVEKMNDDKDLKEQLLLVLQRVMDKKIAQFQEIPLQQLKSIVLKNLDYLWQMHLTELTHLMEGIHLRSYAQKDPKQEYKKDAFELFKSMRKQLNLLIINDFIDLKIDTPFEQSADVFMEFDVENS